MCPLPRRYDSSIYQAAYIQCLPLRIKIDCGIRSITVGNTLCCLVVKTAVRNVSLETTTLLRPKQLGLCNLLSWEAVASGVRADVCHLIHDRALIKLDFKKAFNLVRRDVLYQSCPKVRSFRPSVHH